MDFGAITGAITAISAAKDLARAALTVRDANALAVAVSQMNDQLLKAQESLFTHNAALLQLQNQHFETSEELRKLKEAVRERGSYSLVEITHGSFAYRVNVTPEQGGASEPGSAQPPHYVCQPCFDSGVKAVLGRTESDTWGIREICPVCKREIYCGHP